MTSSDGADLFELEPRGPTLVLHVRAEQLTVVAATDRFDEGVRTLLAERSERNWVMDFRSVTFMVTPAVNSILVAHKHLSAAGGAIVLTGLSDNIRQIFALMRLDEVIPIASSVEGAVHWVGD